MKALLAALVSLVAGWGAFLLILSNDKALKAVVVGILLAALFIILVAIYFTFRKEKGPRGADVP